MNETLINSINKKYQINKNHESDIFDQRQVSRKSFLCKSLFLRSECTEHCSPAKCALLSESAAHTGSSFLPVLALYCVNKPGPAQVGAISKVQQVVKFGEKSIMLYEKRKRYIRTFKRSYPNFETLYRN